MKTIHKHSSMDTAAVADDEKFPQSSPCRHVPPLLKLYQKILHVSSSLSLLADECKSVWNQGMLSTDADQNASGRNWDRLATNQSNEICDVTLSWN